jgi:hypothetical protein
MKKLLIIAVALTVHSEAMGGEILITGPMSSSELPREVRKESYELDGGWEQIALGLPSIRIMGGTLRIDEASERSNRITASQIIVEDGEIITNGADLTINTLRLEVRGRSSIKSFDRVLQSAAQVGQSGRSGLAGGTVTLNAREFRSDGSFLINLSGTPGESGGIGAAGSPGAAGAYGEPARFKTNSLRLECRQGGNGGPGGRGGEGGPGGNGGDGGDGGNLVLGGILVKFRSAINFTANGGEAGVGGLGGPGGQGGRGGLAGRPEGPCGGGSNGPDGPGGPNGPIGPSGALGRPGSIRADF